MLPVKANHPQAVYRVEMPPEHTALLMRLSQAVEKINATKIYPTMRITQVGSWPWRNYLKQHMNSKGMPISEALLAILDSGDWDVRVEPEDDTVSLHPRALHSFVTELLNALDIKQDVPVLSYFSTKWQPANVSLEVDLSVQSYQIKPINCYDINLKIHGEILFDDSLNGTPGTHQNLFMGFIEKKEIITPHIFGTLETFKKSLEQKRELSALEASRLYFMMKSYIKPLRIPGVHFHLNTSQAWCDFMMMPETKDYYKQLSDKVIKRYHCNVDDFKLFEAAVQRAYIFDTMPRMFEMVEQLHHDLKVYKNIQGLDFADVDIAKIEEELKALLGIEQVYDFDKRLTVAARLVAEQLVTLKQKSKVVDEPPKEVPLPAVKLEVKSTPSKTPKKLPPVVSSDPSHCDADNIPVNKLVQESLDYLVKHHTHLQLVDDYSHMYESLWQGLFKEKGEGYRQLTPKQRSLFISGFIMNLLKDKVMWKRGGDAKDIAISYLLNTYAQAPDELFASADWRRKYVSGLYVWFSLIKPFGVSDTSEFMLDFLKGHDVLYDPLIKACLLCEFESMNIRISELPPVATLPIRSGKHSIPVPRVLSFFYDNGEVSEQLFSAISFYDRMRTMIDKDIRFRHATFEVEPTQESAVISSDAFINIIRAHAYYVLGLLTEPCRKAALKNFIKHFEYAVPVYRQLYCQLYQERLQVLNFLMPFMLEEAIVGVKKPRTLAQIFKSSAQRYKKSHPEHEPGEEDLNPYWIPTINSALALGDLLHAWDPNDPSRHKALHDAYMKDPVNEKNLPASMQLMRQLNDVQDKEPIENFNKAYQRFLSFVDYHFKQKTGAKPKVSSSLKPS